MPIPRRRAMATEAKRFLYRFTGMTIALPYLRQHGLVRGNRLSPQSAINRHGR